MAKARKVKQLGFEMADRPGLLSEVTGAVSSAKVDIRAICAYGMEGKAYFMMTTDSNARARKGLVKLGVQAKEEDVIAVEMANKAGELKKTAKRLADAGININYMYGTAATGRTAIGIFSTSDDNKAIRAINK